MFIIILNIRTITERDQIVNPLDPFHKSVCWHMCESIRSCLEYVTQVMFNLTERKNCSILDKLEWKCLSNDLPNPQMSRSTVCQ